MRETMYEDTCVVVAKRNTEHEKLEETSCSGIVLDQKNGIILTHASLFTSFIPKETALKLQHDNYLYQKDITRTCNVSILLQCKAQSAKHKSNVQHRRLFYTALVNCVQQGNAVTNISSCPADIISIFKCQQFAEAIYKLLPESDGWKIWEENDCKIGELVSKILLSCFVVLKLRNNHPNLDSLPASMPPYQTIISSGDTAYICGTPFGSLSPEVFMNSISKGIVSNICRDGSLILTDARCIPGSEGGAFYTQTSHDLQRRLCGIVVSPLCWKNNEWIGMAIVCSMSAVFKSLQDYYTVETVPKTNLNLLPSNKNMSDKIKALYRRVVLVKCGSNWGSGIIVDVSNGIALTCSHVLKGNHSTKVTVRMDLPQSQLWCDAEVLYKNTLGAVYDVAVLKLNLGEKADNWAGILESLESNIEVENHVEIGTDVLVIGHGLIAEDKDLEPSLSNGVVSKVINSPSKQHQCVMIQTTCAVHGGASGGAVLSKSGRFIAMVTCNAKDVESGASYPHVNMSVPFTELWPVIEEYKISKDHSCFEKLHIADRDIENLWLLRKTDDQTFSVKSKL